MKIENNSEWLTLTDATKRIPSRDGKRVNSSTVWRWCRVGIKSRSNKRVRLDHVRIGGRVYTTETALAEFYCAVAKADLEHFQREPVASPKRHTSKQRLRSIEKAKQTLKKAGIV